MAASVVQSKSGAQNTGLGTVTVTWTTPATAGNLLLITTGSDDYRTNNAAGTPSGFTLVPGGSQQTNLGHYMWYKVAAGGETSASFTIGSAATWCWVTMEVAGLTSTPVDVSNGSFQASPGNTYTTPTITPTAGDRFIVAAIGGSGSAGALPGLDSWTNSFVEVADGFTTLASGTRDVVGTAQRAVTANGSTGYSTGATYTSGGPTARTAIITAFKVATAGGTDATVTPASVAATAAVPVSSRSAGSRATPGPVSGLAAIPSPARAAGSTVTQATVAVIATGPAPQVASGSSTTVLPALIAATAAVRTVAVSTGARTSPARILTSASIPAVAVAAGATANPARIVAAATVPAVTVTTAFVSITARAGRPERTWSADTPRTAWTAAPPTL